jgi:hypothetical protein
MVRVVNSPDDKARQAAAVLASGDVRHQELLLQFTKLESRVDKLAWMIRASTSPSPWSCSVSFFSRPDTAAGDRPVLARIADESVRRRLPRR